MVIMNLSSNLAQLLALGKLFKGVSTEALGTGKQGLLGRGLRGRHHRRHWLGQEDNLEDQIGAGCEGSEMQC